MGWIIGVRLRGSVRQRLGDEKENGGKWRRRRNEEPGKEGKSAGRRRQRVRLRGREKFKKEKYR